MSNTSRVHGGLDAAELAALGLDPAAVLDLSVNVNPWGPHPEVVAAIQRASLSRYPQPLAAGARAALARTAGVDPAQVIVGHGSTELLWSAVSLLSADPRPLLIAGPTFSEPVLAARAYGVRWRELQSNPETEFVLDLSKLARAIEEHDAQAVYLCQPNNPDGSCVPAARLRELCDAYRSCLFIIDQAFLSLSTRHADAALHFPENVLLVRSLTKEHALPGLRVGYALGAPELIERLNARRPSWMVSGLAEAAIIEACAHGDYVAQVRMFLLDARGTLAAACTDLGMQVLPSTTSYFLMRVPHADSFRARLLSRHAIAVRSCSSFGLADYVRIAGCGPQQRAQLIAAVEAERAR
ncbi:MAG TPA: histidinol-phosphate transaminase [Polyangiales bacterium]|nr:histidinol-phosphate transaminase [Polyangiales bacterium]